MIFKFFIILNIYREIVLIIMNRKTKGKLKSNRINDQKNSSLFSVNVKKRTTS